LPGSPGSDEHGETFDAIQRTTWLTTRPHGWLLARSSRRRRLSMTHDTILAAFLAHAAATPDRPCLTWEGTTISYGELARAAVRWRDSYVKSGIQLGDRVGLYLGSGPAFIAAYLGAHLARGAAVLLNTQYRRVELGHILADSAPRALVTEAGLGDEVAGVLPGLAEPPAVIVAGAGVFGLAEDGGRPAELPGGEELPGRGDLALLAYTSGTTGRAKGAMLSHGNLAANSAAVTAAWRWTAADRLLLTLPLFHIHGLGVGVHGALLVGGSIDLRPRFDAGEMLDTLATGAISMFFGVPTMYGRLAQEAEARPELAVRAGRALRLLVSGSAALPPHTFAAVERLFGQRILERYGMTETVMNLTNPFDGERRPGTVGGPFPGQEARVVDVRGRQPLPDGEVGEIQVRGPHVCMGYWRNPAATAEVFGADGWFSTGDLGWRSADGYYTITGRARELIISGGYNIYPREVEEVLMAHPDVAEAAVIGQPDADFGEQVVAVLVLRPGLSPAPEREAALAAFLRERLAAYKRPRAFIYVNSLPRNAMGKVQKQLLAAGLLSERA